MFYFVKTPQWLKRIYDNYIWSIPSGANCVYLTFDDGPNSVATPFVLSELKKYNALGTFFCIGKNVVENPVLFKNIIDHGHAIGNHTYNHPNGWTTGNKKYLEDIAKASEVIDSNLFRPPYGKITSFQAKNLKSVMRGKTPKVIMWDVISGDFDNGCTPERCLSNVVLKSVPGSIIVFHDSEKAFPKLEYALPRALKFFSEKGFQFNSIPI